MVFIFGVDFSSPNNNIPLRHYDSLPSSSSSSSLPQQQSMMTTTNNNPEDFKKICLNEEKVVSGSKLNIGVTVKGKEVLKYEQHQPSNSKISFNINHTQNDSVCELKMSKYEFPNPPMIFSCIVCQKVFPSKRSLGGHKKAHKSNPKNNNQVASMKGNEVVKSEQYQPSSSKMSIYIDHNKNEPIYGMMGQTLRGHQMSLKREREEHDIFIASKTFSCKNCNRSFSSAQALGGHVKVHKRKLNPIKLEVGESSINVDTKSNSILHKSPVVALPLDLSLKL